MNTESTDSAAVASPIGKSVVGKRAEVTYAPGMRTRERARILCRNDNPDLPHAQKYPLKLKCTPAKRVSTDSTNKSTT